MDKVIMFLLATFFGGVSGVEGGQARKGWG